MARVLILSLRHMEFRCCCIVDIGLVTMGCVLFILLLVFLFFAVSVLCPQRRCMHRISASLLFSIARAVGAADAVSSRR